MYKGYVGIGPKGIGYAGGVGIGKDNLPKALAPDDAEECLHALLVEFLEDVVEEEDG